MATLRTLEDTSYTGSETRAFISTGFAGTKMKPKIDKIDKIELALIKYSTKKQTQQNNDKTLRIMMILINLVHTGSGS